MAQRIGRGAARAEDAEGTPTQSHISPSLPVYEEKCGHLWQKRRVGRSSSLATPTMSGPCLMEYVDGCFKVDKLILPSHITPMDSQRKDPTQSRNLIWMSTCEKNSGSMKITIHLHHISGCEKGEEMRVPVAKAQGRRSLLPACEHHPSILCSFIFLDAGARRPLHLELAARTVS